MTLGFLGGTIAERYGLILRQNWESDLEQAVEIFRRRAGMSAAAFIEQAAGTPELLRDLAGHLTVDESYFLRDPQHFEVALEHIERRLSPKSSAPSFVAWSVGCSRGEEPYSLAAMVAERLAWARAGVRIMASDLRREAIAAAQGGSFSDWSFRGAPEWLRARYFQKVADRWVLDESLRGSVKFVHLAISEHLPLIEPRSVDLVLFRNVAIYLSKTALERLYLGLSRVLREDGLLITGPSDPLPTQTLFAPAGNSVASIFRLRDARAPFEAPNLAQGSRFCPCETELPSQSCSPLLEARDPSAGWSGSPQLPTSPCSDAKSLFAEATRLGDEGKCDLALASAGQVIAAAPQWKAGYLLRGTLLLAESRAEEAAADLRRAVFLAPEDPAARYLYATALRAAGLDSQCLSEVRELVSRLEGVPREIVLEDGHATTGHLLNAAKLLMGDDA
jgi:chemotaxis protein methyltransferase CheR